MKRIAWLGWLAMCASCGSAGGDASSYTGPTVYSVGIYRTESGLVSPALWKNGQRTDLDTGGAGGTATAVTMMGQTPVVAGYYRGTLESTPCFWNGGTRTDLPVPANTTVGYALGIAASGTTLYLAGFYTDSHAHPTLWTVAGGVITRVDLPFSGASAQARSVVASSTTAFVTGTGQPGYWTVAGSVAQRVDLDLGSTFSSVTLNAVTVSGDTVSCAGQCTLKDFSSTQPGDSPFRGCLWSGTTLVQLDATGFGNVHGLTTAGSTTYAVGEGVNGPAVWKVSGGVPSRLDLGKTGGANAIAVKDGTVYAGGSFYDEPRDAQAPCFWVGTARYTLPSATGRQLDAEVLGIAVP